tara:strand:+ start:56 stop:520 length:465 start_codon:yes stop_codon:yes gene_type:complete
MPHKDPQQRKEYQKQYYQKNKEYARIKNKEWRENNKGYYKLSRKEYNKKYYDNPVNKLKRRETHLKKVYGIDLSEYNRLLESQDYACCICRTKHPGNKGGGGNFHVDHCHETGRVRGLLCSSCNTALGSFKEDPSVLYKAADYLMGVKLNNGNV